MVNLLAPCQNFFKKNDPDRVFAYNTTKFVRIQDRRLGLLNYGFQLLIFAYIVGFILFYSRGYLKRADPIGAIRSSLKAPEAFVPAHTQDYCSENPHPTRYNVPCVFWDELQVQYPMSQESSMIISTRVSSSTETKNCSQTEHLCRYKSSAQDEVYPAEIERFTVMIDHAVRTRDPAVNVSANMREMVGSLFNTSGNVMAVCNDTKDNHCRRGIKRGDIFKVGDLLSAANIDLDDSSISSSTNSSYRYDGIVLICEIEYSNTDNKLPFDFETIQYRYKIDVIPGAEYKVLQVIYHEYPNSRIAFDRHGIRLVFLMSGQLGYPNVQATLLQFVSGMALLSLATAIVDFLAMKVMPMRQHYRQYKYEETIDFSDLRDGLLDNEVGLKDPTINNSNTTGKNKLQTKYAPLKNDGDPARRS